jgi:Tfp pilus assembly protein PilF
VSLGRHDEAIVRLREAVRLAPESADIQMNLANALQARGSFEDAIAAYRAALVNRPEWGEAQHNLGIALRRAGRVDEAAAAFETAARWLPGSALVRVSYASLLSSMGRLDDAVAQFDLALQAPDVQRAAEIHNEMGVLFLRMAKPAAAIPHFEAALQIRPDFAAARENLTRARK